MGDVVGETVRETTCAHTRSPPPPPPRSWKRTLTHLRSPCFCVRLVCRDTSTGLPASACTVRRARTNDASAACRTTTPATAQCSALQLLSQLPGRSKSGESVLARAVSQLFLGPPPSQYRTLAASRASRASRARLVGVASPSGDIVDFSQCSGSRCSVSLRCAHGRWWTYVCVQQARHVGVAVRRGRRLACRLATSDRVCMRGHRGEVHACLRQLQQRLPTTHPHPHLEMVVGSNRLLGVVAWTLTHARRARAGVSRGIVPVAPPAAQRPSSCVRNTRV